MTLRFLERFRETIHQSCFLQPFHGFGLGGRVLSHAHGFKIARDPACAECSSRISGCQDFRDCLIVGDLPSMRLSLNGSQGADDIPQVHPCTKALCDIAVLQDQCKSCRDCMTRRSCHWQPDGQSLPHQLLLGRMPSRLQPAA